jgi:hypothetical protein
MTARRKEIFIFCAKPSGPPDRFFPNPVNLVNPVHNSVMPPQITACLAPDEEILWQEQPRPYVFLLRGLPAIFFGMTWSILGAYWYYGATLAFWQGWWKLVPTFSLPFIFAGWSFFFYPINLGARARHTWYVVTNRRVFIARLHGKKSPELRVFTHREMGPPHVVKRLDGLYEIVLTRSAQGRPYLIPRLESGFFGIKDAKAAAAAIRKIMDQ